MGIDELQTLIYRKMMALEDLEDEHRRKKAAWEEESFNLQSKTGKLQQILDEKQSIARRFLSQHQEEEYVPELNNLLGRQFDSWQMLVQEERHQAQYQLDRKQAEQDDEYRRQKYQLESEIEELTYQRRQLEER